MFIYDSLNSFSSCFKNVAAVSFGAQLSFFAMFSTLGIEFYFVWYQDHYTFFCLLFGELLSIPLFFVFLNDFVVGVYLTYIKVVI